MTKVKLGQEVVDTVSGFTGIAIARTDWLNGCARIIVQPPVDKEGKLPEDKQFDEPQMAIVNETPHPRGPTNTGGPTSSKPSQNTTKQQRTNK